MNSKTNYTLVGAFVIFSTVLVVLFVVWLLKPTAEEELLTYKVEFSESVAGLNVDAPVKYRGVQIGKVKSIRISPKNFENIDVFISVRKGTPIKTDTVAKLKPQGITGLSYVDLSQGSAKSPLLLPKNRHDIPVIRSVPSFFVKIEQSFGSMSVNLRSVLVRLKRLLNEDNQEEITRILKNVADITETLNREMQPQRFGHLDTLVVSLTSLSRRLEQSMPNLDRLIRSGDALAVQTKASMASLRQTMQRASETLRGIDARNKNGDYSLRENLQPAMVSFSRAMQQLQTSLMLLERLLMRYGDNPSQMLFENQSPRVGPGEKK